MKKGLVALGIVVLCAVLGSITYEKTIKSRTDFASEIRKFPRALVIFYETKFDTKEERRAYEKSFKNARRAFDSVGKMNRYKDSSVAFLRVDLDKNELVTVAKQYGVDTLPTYMLFIDGRPLKTQQGAVVQRTGFLEKDDIINLIERHYGRDINSILKELSRLRQREREERAQSGWSPYFYWGYGGGYPYGYPYYYYQPGPSFGFSVGL